MKITPKTIGFVILLIVIQMVAHTVQAKCYKQAYRSDIATGQLLLVLEQSGLPPTEFEIMASDKVPYAVATKCGGVRYIYVNEKWLSSNIKYNYRDWKGLGTLAHEIAHHILDHPSSRHSQKNELEADRYAGHILYHLGATLNQATQMPKSLPREGSVRHPNRDERIEAVTAGWENARNPISVIVAGVSFPNMRLYWDRGYSIDAIGYGPTTDREDERWHVVLTKREKGEQACVINESREGLEKEIQELWDKDYLIDSLYYLDDQWIALMSKGKGYADLSQSWFESSSFDDIEEEIEKGWFDEDEYISSLTYSDRFYILVMTQGDVYQTYSLRQKYSEIRESMYKRWAKNNFITSLNYSKYDGWVLVATEDKLSHNEFVLIEPYFPEETIEFHVRKNYRVAHLTYNYRHQQWIVVLTTRDNKLY